MEEDQAARRIDHGHGDGPAPLGGEALRRRGHRLGGLECQAASVPQVTHAQAPSRCRRCAPGWSPDAVYLAGGTTTSWMRARVSCRSFSQTSGLDWAISAGAIQRLLLASWAPSDVP